MEFIDTHAHLYVNQFEADRNEMIKRAKDNNITKVLLPNIDKDSAENLLELYFSDTTFFAPMMGIHPCSINENYKTQLKEIEPYFLRQKMASVGEIGLDYYWDKTKIKEQKAAFRHQINWAKDMNLPIAVHCRDAFDDVLSILDEEQNGNLKGVLHCFTGNVEQAKHLIDLGFYMGIGGVVTYKNSGLDKTLADIDVKHLILETDAPYLSPTPYRGKRNESAYLIYIAEKLAEVKGIEIEELAEKTTKNAVELFSL
ncbi:MAG: TatD family hydrolase [Bacteroidetes bacterium]|nr:TatD family hydrolase [Bacteroidota bacterium]MCB9225806.1 TatD family hydrolase [Chitinophagales bacterium]